jgi:predicted signal transduction protein with EAL and GGDEF domain
MFARAISRRADFNDATYIAIGFLGLLTALISDVARNLMHAPSPFLDRWEIELGSSFDVLAFAVAVTLRARCTERQRASDLVIALFEAMHDGLTGLLNRRGLEGRFALVEGFVSTVLFIDLDDFKAINDRAGTRRATMRSRSWRASCATPFEQTTSSRGSGATSSWSY